MALSNIAAEPRRELIEQGVGVAVLVLLGILDFKVSARVSAWSHNDPPLVVDMLLLPLAFLAFLFLAGLLFTGLWYLAHALGEGACALLKVAGLEIRPKQRRHEKPFWKYKGLIQHDRTCIDRDCLK